MKKFAAAFCCALWLVLILADAVGAATRRDNPPQKQQLPPGLEVFGEIPEEFFMRRLNCTKEEHELLDAMDEHFINLTSPVPNREAREFLAILMNERERMRAATDLYSKCGRFPNHPIETDPKVLEEDMRQIEEYNRRNTGRDNRR